MAELDLATLETKRIQVYTGRLVNHLVAEFWIPGLISCRTNQRSTYFAY